MMGQAQGMALWAGVMPGIFKRNNALAGGPGELGKFFF